MRSGRKIERKSINGDRKKKMITEMPQQTLKISCCVSPRSSPPPWERRIAID
jgi:hypothetical protein